MKKMVAEVNSIFDRKQKAGMTGLLFLIIIGSFFEMLGVSAVLPLVSIISDPDKINEGIYHKAASMLGITGADELTLVLAGVLIVIYIIKNIYILFMYSMQYRFVYNNQRIISKRLMDYYMGREYLFHTSHGVAELQRNVSYDVNGFFYVILNAIQLISEAVTCLFLVAFLMINDALTTILILVLMLVFLYLVFYVFKKKLVILGQRNRAANAAMNKGILHAFQGIKEIKASDREDYFLNEYDRAYREMVSVSRRQSLLNIAPRPVMETVMICGLLGFISLRIYLGGDMTSIVPTLSVFAVAAIRMLPSFNRISGNIGIILSNKASVEALHKDLGSIGDKEAGSPKQGLGAEQEGILTDSIDASKQAGSPKQGLGAENEPPVRLREAIRIENVSFSYPGRSDKKVLDGVSLEIPKNSSVAFIGPTGAGKTTLADIILGLLPPTEGRILADDTDVYEHLKAWHHNIGYIPQDIYLTDGTVKENVAFGLSTSGVSDEEVWEALRQAQAASFVHELPEGLASRVGPDGVQLSGGQRQRIGIARALLKKPEILVLDEATSALDNDTESAVMEAVNAFSGSKTLIIIAHRLSTIEGCDRIYEVKDGKVILQTSKPAGSPKHSLGAKENSDAR